LILGITTAYFAINSNRLAHYESEANDAQRADATIRAAATGITFDRPRGPITRCTEITGNAQQIPGWILWIAHRALKNQDYFLKRVTQTQNDWTSGRWTIGGGADSVNSEYEIIAFYVQPEVDDFLRSIVGDPHATKLPPGIRSSTNMIVTRDSDKSELSCSGGQ
jgi:hypothetical protein